MRVRSTKWDATGMLDCDLGVGAYAATWAGLILCTQLAHRLLAGVAVPGWVVQHIGLMTELARGLMPYMAGAIIFCLGLGAHLPGTRRP